MINKEYVENVYESMQELNESNEDQKRNAYAFLSRATLSGEELIYLADKINDEKGEEDKEGDKRKEENEGLLNKLSQIEILLRGLEGKLPDDLRRILE